MALNLANEIVEGKRSVAQAQSFMKRTMMTSMAGKSSPYTEKLLFKPSKSAGSAVPSGQPQMPQPTRQPGY